MRPCDEGETMLFQAGIFYDEPYPWRMWNPDKQHIEKVEFLEGIQQLAKLCGIQWTPPHDKHYGAPFGGTKILCVGRNYRPHVQEMGNAMPSEPLWFSKPPSSTIGHGETVRLPAGFGQIDYEGELALVIGRKAHGLKPSEALDVVAGITLALDITARDLQKKENTWVRAKGFDTFCPLGPWILPFEPGWLEAGLQTELNGAVVQRDTLKSLIFPVPELLAHLTATMTLFPGDVILTGTPAGVGPLKAGDRLRVTAEGPATISLEVSVAEAVKKSEK